MFSIKARGLICLSSYGDHVAIYLFEESEVSYRRRAEGLGLSMDGFIDKGLVALNHVGVAELSAGEFTARLRQEVEENGVRTVVLDTLNGYANAMLDEEYLIPQLHELFAYLSHKGVTTLPRPGNQGKSRLSLSAR